MQIICKKKLAGTLLQSDVVDDKARNMRREKKKLIATAGWSVYVTSKRSISSFTIINNLVFMNL